MGLVQEHPVVLQLWQLYVRCKSWNALPDEGGYFDQDALMMEALGAIDAGLNELEAAVTAEIMSKAR